MIHLFSKDILEDEQDGRREKTQIRPEADAQIATPEDPRGILRRTHENEVLNGHHGGRRQSGVAASRYSKRKNSKLRSEKIKAEFYLNKELEENRADFQDWMIAGPGLRQLCLLLEAGWLEANEKIRWNPWPCPLSNLAHEAIFEGRHPLPIAIAKLVLEHRGIDKSLIFVMDRDPISFSKQVGERLATLYVRTEVYFLLPGILDYISEELGFNRWYISCDKGYI